MTIAGSPGSMMSRLIQARTISSWSVLLAAALVAAGCGAPGKLNTPSRRPEVSLPGATPEEASALCVARLQLDRYTIEDATPYRVLGITGNLNDIGSGSAALALTRGNVSARARVTFTIVRSIGGATIYSSLFHVSGDGPLRERSLECMRQDHFEKLQRRLEAIRDEYLKARGLPPLPSALTQKLVPPQH